MSLSSYDIYYTVHITVYIQYVTWLYTEYTQFELAKLIRLGLADQQAETKEYYNGESLFLICTDCMIKRGSSVQPHNGEDRKEKLPTSWGLIPGTQQFQPPSQPLIHRYYSQLGAVVPFPSSTLMNCNRKPLILLVMQSVHNCCRYTGD